MFLSFVSTFYSPEEDCLCGRFILNLVKLFSFYHISFNFATPSLFLSLLIIGMVIFSPFRVIRKPERLRLLYLPLTLHKLCCLICGVSRWRRRNLLKFMLIFSDFEVDTLPLFFQCTNPICIWPLYLPSSIVVMYASSAIFKYN